MAQYNEIEVRFLALFETEMNISLHLNAKHLKFHSDAWNILQYVD